MVAPLRGLGLWIWEMAKCDGGDVWKIVDRCKRVGANWICAKVGESHFNGQLTEDNVAQFRSNGIEIAGWWFSRPTTAQEELEMLAGPAYGIGLRHFVMDAETPWETRVVDGTGADGAPTKKTIPWDWRILAAQYAHGLRSRLGSDVFLADAPWPITRAHPLFPFAEFGSICDMRMPQAYYAVAELDGNESPTKYLADFDLLWARNREPVCPILSNVNGNGSRHSALSTFSASLDRYAARAASSIWSYQHITDTEWAMLEQRNEVGLSPVA